MPQRGHFRSRVRVIVPRWIWFVPLAALVASLSLVVFRYGWIAATITETDVIETYTQLYLDTYADTAQATDCTAQPAPRLPVWIIVTCIAADGTRVDYPVDRLGRLREVAPSPPRGDRPNT